MAGEWRTVRISTITDVTDYVANGSFASLREHVTYRNEPDYAILVRLVDYNASWNGDYVYVDKKSYEFLRKSSLDPGDVVIANVGANAGTVFRVPDLGKKMTIGPNSILCRPTDESVLNRNYLYYYLISPSGQQSIRSILSGSAQPKFNKTDFRNLAIPLPPLRKQQAFACILGALDDKIELNWRMNRTLEATARAIFKSWFVDFDPVRAKAAGQQPPGLKPEIAAIFPDSFEDSELGEIPKGWRVGTLGEMCELAYGKALKADQRKAGSISVMGSNGQVGVHNQALVKGPGIVVGRKGNPGIVTWVNTDFFPIDTTFYIVPSGPEYLLTFLFYALENLNLARFSADSAVPGLNRQIAYGAQLVIPHNDVLESFALLAVPIHDRQYATETESRILAATRDTLLPKLISGELLVKDAERIAGRAV